MKMNPIRNIPMKKTTAQSISFLFLMVLLSNNGFSLTLNSNISSGYDSNPSTLADKFNPEGATFVRIRATISQKITSNIKTSINVNSRNYGSDGKNGDTNRSKISLKYKDKIGDTIKSTLSLAANIGMFDKTYVSHTTGSIGTYSDQDLSDRYDYQWWSTSASISKNITRRLTANFGSELLVRDYEDYDIAGLSNFDYRQLTFSTRWRYRLSKYHRSILDLGLSKREFDDRREASLAGVKIDDTDLKYSRQKISLSHRYKISSHLTLEGRLSYLSQHDSGGGFYNYTRKASKLSIGYRILPLSNFQTQISYYTDGYQRIGNLDDDVTTEERFTDREGLKLGLRFESKLPFKALLGKRSKNAYPAIFIQWERKNVETNSDTNYTYDRQQIQAGILFHF